MSARLKRREFITLVGGAVAAWPIATSAHGRRLASLRGVEEAFSQAASVNGEISAPHVLASCPHPWNRWPILMSGLIAACLLAGVLVLLYSKRSVKPASM